MVHLWFYFPLVIGWGICVFALQLVTSGGKMGWVNVFVLQHIISIYCLGNIEEIVFYCWYNNNKLKFKLGTCRTIKLLKIVAKPYGLSFLEKEIGYQANYDQSNIMNHIFLTY